MRSLAWMLALCICSASYASTTRVGNGDDGSDLEGLTEITSGVIFSSREEAIKRLKGLNVQGIPGLGLLIPELENTKLLMTSEDVSPIESEGEWEIAKDKKKVYARTFAEPHAPTRFFPVALSLKREQLIALHTHEALHRALPASVREDENKVALLTLALTSPSANFDRVNRIVRTTLGLGSDKETTVARSRSTAASSSSSMSIRFEEDKKTADPQLEYGAVVFDGIEGATTAQFVEAEFSPLGAMRVGDTPIEPRLGIRGYLIHSFGDAYAGPVSFNARAAISKTNYKYGPIARVSLRALEGDFLEYEPVDRDVYTLGGFYSRESYSGYFKSDVTYTLSSESASNRDYGAIWSTDIATGYKVKGFQLGMKLDFDHMMEEGRSNSFSLVQLGPELGWNSSWFSVALSGGILLNRRSESTLTDLADLVGHGTGDSNISFNMAFDI